MTLLAMVDIYSGRRNPSWELSEEQIAELRHMVDAARQSDPPRGQPFDGLGYRGVSVINSDLEESLPYRIDAISGFVTIVEQPGSEPDNIHRHADTAGIEEWILAQAQARDLGRDIAAMGGPPRVPPRSSQ